MGVSIFPLGYRNLPFHFQVLRVNERFLNYPPEVLDGFLIWYTVSTGRVETIFV